MSFCPVCGAHHDPKFPCADRAGELLRDAGIEPKPIAEKELKKTIKKANRSMIVLLIVVLSLLILTILLSEFISKMK
jgi:predicted nucleic acid-binding Zn ribbon protein